MFTDVILQVVTGCKVHTVFLLLPHQMKIQIDLPTVHHPACQLRHYCHLIWSQFSASQSNLWAIITVAVTKKKRKKKSCLASGECSVEIYCRTKSLMFICSAVIKASPRWVREPDRCIWRRKVSINRGEGGWSTLWVNAWFELSPRSKRSQIRSRLITDDLSV